MWKHLIRQKGGGTSTSSTTASTSDPCANAPAGSQLGSACACQKAANALATALTQYNANYEKYATQQAAYARALNAYNIAHSAWNSNKKARISQLSDEKVTMACGGCGTTKVVIRMG